MREHALSQAADIRRYRRYQTLGADHHDSVPKLLFRYPIQHCVLTVRVGAGGKGAPSRVIPMSVRGLAGAKCQDLWQQSQVKRPQPQNTSSQSMKQPKE